MVVKSELNIKNTIAAIGALAVPVLRQGFVIISCRLEGKQNRQLDYKGTNNV